MKPIKTIEEANPAKTSQVHIYKFTPEEFESIKVTDFETLNNYIGNYTGKDFIPQQAQALKVAAILKEDKFPKYKKNDFISNGYHLAKVVGWLPPQEIELLPEDSLRNHWYQNINYHAILHRTSNLHEKYIDNYVEKPLYIYVCHYVDTKHTLSHLTISISEPVCETIHVPKWFTYSQRKTVNTLLGKTKKEKQEWLKEYFITIAKSYNSMSRLTFGHSIDLNWQIATKEIIVNHLSKLEIDYGRKCSKMLKKLEEDRLLIEISKLAEGVKLPPGIKGKKTKPIPKKEDDNILL